MTAEPMSMSVNEAAVALDVRPETVRRWIAAGKLGAVKDGSRVRIPVAGIEALKRRCEHCGKIYTPARPIRESRFCSAKCRDAAAWEKRKTDEPATRGPGRPRKSCATGEPVNVRLADVVKRIRE